METVLYEYQVNGWELLVLAIMLTAGIGMWFYPKWNPLPAKIERIRKGQNVVARVFSVLFLVTFVLAAFSYGLTYSSYRTACKNDACMTVQGPVEQFNAGLAADNDTESFVIDGVYFAYSGSELLANGYHKTYADGGVVTGNGQELTVKYINDGSKNIILYIGEAESDAQEADAGTEG